MCYKTFSILIVELLRKVSGPGALIKKRSTMSDDELSDESCPLVCYPILFYIYLCGDKYRNTVKVRKNQMWT